MIPESFANYKRHFANSRDCVFGGLCFALHRVALGNVKVFPGMSVLPWRGSERPRKGERLDCILGLGIGVSSFVSLWAEGIFILVILFVFQDGILGGVRCLGYGISNSTTRQRVYTIVRTGNSQPCCIADDIACNLLGTIGTIQPQTVGMPHASRGGLSASTGS